MKTRCQLLWWSCRCKLPPKYNVQFCCATSKHWKVRVEKNLLNLHRSFLIIFGCKIFESESEKVTPNCSLLNIYMEYAWSAWLQTTLLPVQQDFQFQKVNSYDIRKWKWKRQLFCPSWSSNWIVSLVAALIGLAQFTFPGKAKDSESCFFYFEQIEQTICLWLLPVVTHHQPPSPLISGLFLLRKKW